MKDNTQTIKNILKCDILQKVMCSFQCKMQDNHEEEHPITVSDDKTETLQDETVSILLFKYLLHCTL